MLHCAAGRITTTTGKGEVGMRGDVNDRIIEHVEHRMDSLRQCGTIGEVAEFLRNARITGLPRRSGVCPVAMWIRTGAPALLGLHDVEVAPPLVTITYNLLEACGCGCGSDGDEPEPLLHEVQTNAVIDAFVERFDDDDDFAPQLRADDDYIGTHGFYTGFARQWQRERGQ